MILLHINELLLCWKGQTSIQCVIRKGDVEFFLEMLKFQIGLQRNHVWFN